MSTVNRSPAKRVTIRQIAEAAGVSSSVVSTALSGNNSVVGCSLGKKREILRIADRMQYRPREANSIGVVHSSGGRDPELTNWVSMIAPFLSSLHTEANKNNKLLAVYGYSSASLDKGLTEGGAQQVFRRQKIDGLIVMGVFDDFLISHLADARMPYILVNVSDSDSKSLDSVSFDELFTGQHITQYLIEHNHRKIVHVTDFMQSGLHYSVTLRQKGYREAMADAGLEPRVLFHDQRNIEEFREQWGQLFSEPDMPTAIFAYNEDIALICHQYLLESGIPTDQVQIVCTAWRSPLIPQVLKIPYFVLPVQEMVGIAFDTLLKRIAGRDPISAIMLRGRMIDCPGGINEYALP